MMRALALIVALVMMALPAPAQEGLRCAPHAALVGVMQQAGMAIVASPLVDMRTGSFGQAEVWVSPDGLWVLIAVGPDGLACAAMSGVGWHLGEAA